MRRLRLRILVLLLAALVPLAAVAQSLGDAARAAARQNDAKVLSAHTEERGGNRVHVIKLLTRDGVVKVVRVRAPDQREQRDQRGKRGKRDRDR